MFSKKSIQKRQKQLIADKSTKVPKVSPQNSSERERERERVTNEATPE